MSTNDDVSQEYTLLIEFVYKHIDFHDAELHSILEMHNIKLGVDCQFKELPIDTSKQPYMSKRPFKLLTFSWESIIDGQFSVSDNDYIDVKEKKEKCINLVSSLARCTLIRSVIELWGAGPTIDNCVQSIQSGYAQSR